MTYKSPSLLAAYHGYYGEILTDLDDEQLRHLITQHTPKQRLAIFLQWEGIHGYGDTIYAIATGEAE